MFKKPQTIRIAFIFLLMAVWPVISGHAIALNEDQKSFPSKENNSVPFELMAQNQSGNSSNEPLGEIVFLNTTEEGQSAIVSIETSQSVQYTAFKLLNPLRLVLDFPKMNLGNLTSRIQVDKGIVNSIRPIHFKEADVLRLEIVLNQPADYEIQKQNNNKLIVHLQSSKQESGQQLAMSLETAPSSKAEDKNDTSMEAKEEKDSCSQMLYGKKEKISLDFQNVDVRNTFSIFEDISGHNFVLSPEVGGSVNIRMVDVPWNKALEIILSNGSMGRECFGKNIIRIASKAVLVAEETGRVAERARAAIERTNEEEAQDLVTEVVHIDNADITELTTSLTALKSVRTDAQITVDTRTNTLILNDLRKHVDDMLETIRVLDIPTPQILIEAKIVEMSRDFTHELGIQWGFTGELVPGVPGAATLIDPTNASTSTNNNFLVDLAQSSGSGFDLFLGNLIPGVKLNAVLNALENVDKARTISSPRVVVADNKEARLQSGEQIPYVVSSAEGNSVQFVDAEITLTVTPHVTSENAIYMTIDTERNGRGTNVTFVAGGVTTTLPKITTKEAHTEVLVGNGDTTVLGGIYTNTDTENNEAVPFFSKIPILGYLFKSFADSKNVSELMVFITPTIIETN
jgi:type IV pilus assembly protein PilQ